MKEDIDYYPFGTYRDRQDKDTSYPNANYTFTDQEEDDDTGLYNYNARLYDPVLGRFVTADSVVPQPGNLQAYNRYSYCVNNPLVYTDPSGHEITLAAFAVYTLIAAAIGAAANAAIAAAQGGDVGQAALTGAISGAMFYWAGAAIVGLELASVSGGSIVYAGTAARAAAGGIVVATGAAVGGINAAVTGGDVGKGMLMGGVIAGVTFGCGWLMEQPLQRSGESARASTRSEDLMPANEGLERAKEALRKYNPEMYNSERNVTFGHMVGNSSVGETDVLTGNIVISSDTYAGKLTCIQRQDLLETLAHEYSHSNRPLLGRIWDRLVGGNRLENQIERKVLNSLSKEAYRSMCQ